MSPVVVQPGQQAADVRGGRADPGLVQVDQRDRGAVDERVLGWQSPCSGTGAPPGGGPSASRSASRIAAAAATSGRAIATRCALCTTRRTSSRANRGSPTLPRSPSRAGSRIATPRCRTAPARSEQVRLHFGIAPDWIIPLSREEFPKTASGKIQRPLLIEALGEGKFAERHLRIDHFLSTGTLLTDSKARETYYEIRFNSEEKLDLLSLYRHMKRELMESGHWSGDIVLSQGVDRMENGELAVLWKDVLQQDTFVQGQNFFQLGGDSIKAMRLLAKVYETFGVEVTLRQFITDRLLKDCRLWWNVGGNKPVYILPETVKLTRFR